MNFLQYLLIKLIDIYVIIIIIRALISWFSPSPYNPLYIFLISITEPVLGRIRKFTFRLFPTFRIDFSPLIAILLLNIIRNFLLGLYI
jgi:YggT family protein